MLVLAVLLGPIPAFCYRRSKSYPFLNNPILPVLFLFSGISSGAAVALIAMAIRQRSNPHSTEAHFVHRMEIPVCRAKSSCWWRFCQRSGLGDDGKVRALVAALGGGFWTWWFWLGVAGLGLIVPMLLKPWVNRSSGIPAVLAAWGQSGRRVDVAIFHSLRRAVNGGVSQKRGGFWTHSFLKSVSGAVVKSRGQRVDPLTASLRECGCAGLP